MKDDLGTRQSQAPAKGGVEKATEAGQFYYGNLQESDLVVKVPTGGVMEDVVESVEDTVKSKKENGGHSNIGDTESTRWDEGTKAVAFTDEDGNEGAKASMEAFKVNGKDEMPKDASNLEFWWHVQPDDKVGNIQLGDSTPSPKDKSMQRRLENRGFNGNSFVVGARSETVTFFNGDKPIMTIKYSVFKEIGGQ